MTIGGDYKRKSYSLDDTPIAARIEIGFCENPSCGRLHLVMFDEDDTPLATATPGKAEDLINLLVQAKNLMEQMKQ